MPFSSLLQSLAGTLIVSCQAAPDSPLHGPAHMAAMARAAEQGGAGGIRADGPADVAAIRRAVRLPIIGIKKVTDAQGAVVITPNLAAARAVAEAGADLIALSCAHSHRPDADALGELIERIRRDLKLPVVADCAILADGLLAARLGADLLATTLSGYTPDSLWQEGPDLQLVADLRAAQDRPVVAEGRIGTPREADAALRAGAHAVVVGTAITNPVAITARFAAALRG